MRIAQLLIYFIVLLFLLPLSICSALLINENSEQEKKGEPGNIVQYSINLTNDKPYYIDIRIDFGNNSNYLSIDINEYFNIPPNDPINVIVSFYIPISSNISHYLSDVFFYERPSMNDYNDLISNNFTNYQEERRYELITTIESTNERSHSSSDQYFPFLYISSIIFSVLGIIIFINKKKSHIFKPFFQILANIPIFTAYTRLRRKGVLKNHYRNEIMEIVKSEESGISFKEISERADIKHPSFLNYHLKRLLEFDFLRNVDNLYFPRGAPAQSTFLNKINEAIENGARTPSEIAKQVDSYPQKVRYHMKKHGILTVSEPKYLYQRKK